MARCLWWLMWCTLSADTDRPHGNQVLQAVVTLLLGTRVRERRGMSRSRITSMRRPSSAKTCFVAGCGRAPRSAPCCAVKVAYEGRRWSSHLHVDASEEYCFFNVWCWWWLGCDPTARFQSISRAAPCSRRLRSAVRTLRLQASR